MNVRSTACADTAHPYVRGRVGSGSQLHSTDGWRPRNRSVGLARPPIPILFNGWRRVQAVGFVPAQFNSLDTFWAALGTLCAMRRTDCCVVPDICLRGLYYVGLAALIVAMLSSADRGPPGPCPALSGTRDHRHRACHYEPTTRSGQSSGCAAGKQQSELSEEAG